MNLKKIQNLPNNPIVSKVLNTVKILQGYSPILPRYLQFIITYNCNLNCKFCYQAKDKRERFVDMTLDDVRIIEANISKSYFVKPGIHLFGGEPTVNKDFILILEYFSSKGYNTSMTTNGLVIEQYVEKLVSIEGLKDIHISLNTTDFSRTMSILELFERYDLNKKISITLILTINETNQNELLHTIEMFQNTRADYITIHNTTFSDNYISKIDVELVTTLIKEIKRHKFKIPVLFLPDINPVDIPDYYTNPNYPINKNQCVFPWLICYVQPNGDVIPCDEIDIVMGSLKTERLSDIWNNQKFVQFRHSITKKGISYPICKRCCRRQYY